MRLIKLPCSKPAILKENKIPKDVPAQWSVLRWQYQSELLLEIKSRDMERAMQQQAPSGMTLGTAEKTGMIKEQMDDNHLWLCAV